MINQNDNAVKIIGELQEIIMQSMEGLSKLDGLNGTSVSTINGRHSTMIGLACKDKIGRVHRSSEKVICVCPILLTETLAIHDIF